MQLEREYLNAKARRRKGAKKILHVQVQTAKL